MEGVMGCYFYVSFFSLVLCDVRIGEEVSS